MRLHVPKNSDQISRHYHPKKIDSENKNNGKNIFQGIMVGYPIIRLYLNEFIN